MKDIHGAEHLRAGGEARRTVGGRSTAALDALQAAWRRYLSADTYRDQSGPEEDSPKK
ncbi:hypothetical protein [Nocardioides nematodiphilus]|uniref:hypothetical protein n=1 Tax=Nocardioides nematodiphilus TaxID=2849669 RepID=UPI001CDA3A7E|nr:hypothetical protein [Nocardioides nematodiphilus]MCA1984743.1 hypothetical protein [Nocardioides nematodiphilus]